MRERKGDAEALRGRGWRGGGAGVSYREARQYVRKESGGSGGRAGCAVVWRRRDGAEVGIVMLRKIEGRIRMVGGGEARTGVG